MLTRRGAVYSFGQAVHGVLGLGPSVRAAVWTPRPVHSVGARVLQIAAGAEFVDLVEASQGHDICSDEPWVAGIRGAPKRAMGLHPYPAEQRAVADLGIGLV